MSNMGHCRFTNTLSDLRDCEEHMDDPLSDEEEKSRHELVKLCQVVANDYGYTYGDPAMAE